MSMDLEIHRPRQYKFADANRARNNKFTSLFAALKTLSPQERRKWNGLKEHDIDAAVAFLKARIGAGDQRAI